MGGGHIYVVRRPTVFAVEVASQQAMELSVTTGFHVAARRVGIQNQG